MAQTQAATGQGNAESGRTRHPVATFEQGGVEVSVSNNPGKKGDMYNTTIRNSRKDDKSSEWKETFSFGAIDLATPLQLSSRHFRRLAS